MLRSRDDFARLGREGRSRSDRLMLIRYAPNDHHHDRFGISTGRHLGGAVERNRLRRRLREILRRAPGHPGQGWDILIVARPPAAGASYADLRSTTERLLAAIHGPVRASS